MRKIGFLIAIFFIALAGNITAQTDYGIYIAGVKVTSANCDSITGANISGSVSYHHESKTLTLDNASINGDITFGGVEDITITLVGENTIIGGIWSVRGTKTIKGTGSLKATQLNCSNEQNTIIEDCTIDINIATYNWAMYSDGDGSNLTIRNANLSSEGGVAIGDFADIELIGCEIVEPVNAQIIDNEFEGDAGKYICDADSNVAKKVVIKKIDTIDYGITIAGVEVTSVNCNNITGAKISGSVSYNHETKTLTLDNATINGNIGFGGFPPVVEDITITIVGENAAKYIDGVTGTKTINGTGSLKVEYIDNWYEQNTIIENCTIEIVADTAGYEWGTYGPDSKLTIKNANISAQALEVAIGDFKDIELIGCEIVEPANAQIIDNEFNDEEGKYICDADSNIAKKVVIKPIYYGITIAGVKVTSANCNNITGAKISGSVSYNHETKTLTLDNATIDGSIGFGTGSSRIADITITLVGENTTGSILNVSGTKTINGTGSLKVVGYIQCGSEDSTIIEDCTIEIDAVTANYNWAMPGDGSKLTIRNANLLAEGKGVAIARFKEYNFIGCEIVEPANTQIIDNNFDGFTGKFICDGDGNIAKKVVIKPIYYGITIAGVEVTSVNCNNITGANISGSVSYNDDTKTLTLDNATIEGVIYFGNGAEKIEDITITLVGENTMTGTIGSVSSTKIINGTGSLKVVGDFMCDEKNTIIEDCTIEMDATPNDWDWVIYGDDENTTLTIKNANLSAQALEVAIGYFKDIELIGCEIVEPVSAQIIDNEFEKEGYTFAGKYICDADGNIAKKVVIKKSATTIDYGITIANVKVTSANCDNITGEGISGSVSYNHESKTLTLHNATINGNISFGTTPNIIEDITITLVGENTVIGYINPVSDTKTINGTGSLKVEYINNWHEKNSIIEDCTIEIVAGEGYWALYGEGDNSKLTIRSANLSSEGMVAIGSFKDIELVDCEIVEPVNAQIIDNEFEGIAGKFICNEDGTIAKKVVIKKLSGLNDIAQTNNINIYPNPARNKVTIEGKGEIVITNSLGQVVKEIKGNSTYRILNIKDFERGVYYIKVGEITQKLIVE